MKKIALFLALLLTPLGALAQTTDLYRVPTIAALKALNPLRPPIVEVVDANPGIFNLSSGACSAADDIYQVQPTSGTTVCYTRMASQYSVKPLVQTGTGAVPLSLVAFTNNFLLASQFGVVCDGVTDDAPAMRLAVNAAINLRKNLSVQGGQCGLGSTVTINVNTNNDAMIVAGQGPSMNSGSASQSNGTVFKALGSFTMGDMFAVTSFSGVMFKDMQLYSATQRAGGAGIAFLGLPAIPSVGTQNRVDNVAFINMYDGITQSQTALSIISRTYHEGWARYAVACFSNATNETGCGEITSSYFYGDSSGGTTQAANIYVENGYFNIHDNLTMLGSQNTIWSNTKLFSAGSLVIKSNVIENCVLRCAYFQNAGGLTAAQLDVSGNEFTVTSADTGATLKAFIEIAANSGGSGSWVENGIIANNKFRGQLTNGTTPHYLLISSGTNINIPGNVLSHLAGDTAIEFGVGAEAVNVTIAINTNVGSSTGAKYAVTAETRIIDFQGVVFASLPAAAAGGSTIWATDGQVAAPQTLTGGGTGIQALRYNTAWNPTGATEGVAPLYKGGTQADLSATGGTSQVLKQSSIGAVITVGQLAASDLSGGLTVSSSSVPVNGIYLPSANTLGFSTNSTFAGNFDSSQRFNIGYATNVGNGPASNQQQGLQVVGATGNASSIAAVQFSNDGNSPQIKIIKSRGSSLGTNTTVQNGDSLGQFIWRSADGSNYPNVASISVTASGAVSAGVVPTQMAFSTAQDGTGTMTQRLLLGSDGKARFSGETRSDVGFNTNGTAGLTCGPVITLGASITITGGLVTGMTGC